MGKSFCKEQLHTVDFGKTVLMINFQKSSSLFGKTHVSERHSKESCGILWNDLSITRLFQNDSNTFVTKWQWDLENQSGRSHYPNNMSLCLENCRLPDSLPKKAGKVFGKQVLAERFSKYLEKCRECNTFSTSCGLYVLR